MTRPCNRCGECCYDTSCIFRGWLPWQKLPHKFVGRCDFLLADNRCEVINTILYPPFGTEVDKKSKLFVLKFIRGTCTGDRVSGDEGAAFREVPVGQYATKREE